MAGIAAWSSWSHMVAVALRFGERPEVAYVLPLSVDGMLVVASAAMVEDKRAGRRVRWSARVAFIAGVVASVAANIAAAQPSLGARIVAAWPAVALLLVVEMLTRSPHAPGAMVRTDDPSGETGHTSRQRVDTAVDHGTPHSLEISQQADHRPGGEKFGDSRAAAVPARLAAHPTGRRRVTGKRTADIVARLRTERPDASLSEVASAAGVSPRHVRRLIANESTSPDADAEPIGAPGSATNRNTAIPAQPAGMLSAADLTAAREQLTATARADQVQADRDAIRADMADPADHTRTARGAAAHPGRMPGGPPPTGGRSSHPGSDRARLSGIGQPQRGPAPASCGAAVLFGLLERGHRRWRPARRHPPGSNGRSSPGGHAKQGPNAGPA
ncbi:DUF2637 domain-containing protein [Polymorphospora rubra]|uniref:DUF2637 domain-containing protein n=1 Tax=Polymorphospora rubra TaxID=338584 RepID=UPI0033C3B090